MTRKAATLITILLCLTLSASCEVDDVTEVTVTEDTAIPEEAISTEGGESSEAETAIQAPQELINRTALDEAIAECYELRSYTAQYEDIELRQNIICVPLYSETVRAAAEVQINDNLSYTLLSVEFVDDDPDSYEFAHRFGSFDVDAKETIVQDWNTGKDTVTFKTYTDKDKGHIFEINGHAIDCIHVIFSQILVEDEYIIVVTGGTDVNTDMLFIFDHDGNTLFKTYYLTNTGMVIGGHITVEDNKIIIGGTRITHGPSLMIGRNKWLEDNSTEYSDHLYEDTVYDYGDSFTLPYEVYLDKSNADEIKLLNPNEKTYAYFELEYLGEGKFDKLRMTDKFGTLKTFVSGELSDLWEETEEAIVEDTAAANEIDIYDFIDLEWKYSENNGCPYLTKEDILNFDSTAHYYGPKSPYSHNGGIFSFYILSEERTLFGYEGQLQYYGDRTPESLGESVRSEPSAVYDTWYEYVGNGDDVPFFPNMSFVIPNITLTQFKDIMSRIAELTDNDLNDLVFVSSQQHANIDTLDELLSIDDPHSVVDDETLHIFVANGIAVPNHPDWMFTIHWISQERHLMPYYEYDPLDPWEFPILNRLTVTLIKK